MHAIKDLGRTCFSNHLAHFLYARQAFPLLLPHFYWFQLHGRLVVGARECSLPLYSSFSFLQLVHGTFLLLLHFSQFVYNLVGTTSWTRQIECLLHGKIKGSLLFVLLYTWLSISE
ncbi:hypothetical protein DUNSADRAFT_6439 [Dunaliella salina]|uniref:Uncharacterized protein n=1 Tax=Dunaliella salina TaxID=3046 RepID=A0ABQ7H6V6_DUNSA|nr:hypothetical protein DUNSADRAFT_6439 [Dunaliella salina]|eukprot:KAF5842589.1 hypothetical protein DUNSADRAFT_6439 [Dunaliella salina]